MRVHRPGPRSPPGMDASGSSACRQFYSSHLGNVQPAITAKPASEFGDGLWGDRGFRTPRPPLRPKLALQPERTSLSAPRSSGFRTAGSPRTLKIRTCGAPVNIGFYVAGPTGMNGRLCNRPLRHALVLDELPAEVPTPPAAPGPKPDRTALFQAVPDAGLVRNRADLARALGCSRAWVTRVLGTRPCQA